MISLADSVHGGLPEGALSDALHANGLSPEPADSLHAGSVLVIDEAGMLGSRQMADILERADDAGAKVVLVGDARQLQAIEAGSAFRAVREQVGGAELNENRRQMSPEDREVVQAFRDGNAARALTMQDKRGQLDVSSTPREAKEAMGRDLARDLSEGKSSIGLAATRLQAHDINEAARHSAQEAGIVGGENVAVRTAHGQREFSIGDTVMFERNVNRAAARETWGEIKNGERGVITHITQAKSFGETRRIEMDVQMEHGGSRHINTDTYNHLDHGYATTVHKAQGATVDRTRALVAESGVPTGREWAYVASSRHREELKLYADKASLADLAPQLAKSHAKDTTLDYATVEREGRRQATPETKLNCSSEPSRGREADTGREGRSAQETQNATAKPLRNVEERDSARGLESPEARPHVSERAIEREKPHADRSHDKANQAPVCGSTVVENRNGTVRMNDAGRHKDTDTPHRRETESQRTNAPKRNTRPEHAIESRGKRDGANSPRQPAHRKPPADRSQSREAEPPPTRSPAKERDLDFGR